MRTFALLVVLGCLAIILPGCGPAVPQKELGKVEFSVPDVPGAETPYPLPEIAPPPDVLKAKQEFSVPPKPPSAKPAEP